VIYGAGAVGGAIGGRLFEHGHDVVLVARGAHHDAVADRGLVLETPDGVVTLPVPVTRSPAEAGIRPDDVVLLCMKTQDTAAALNDLADAVDDPVPVVCVQNGVENERLALRLFPDVYGVCVMLPATHLEPGLVQAESTPVTGILDIGRYPTGTDELTDAVASDLADSTFSSRPDPAIMRSKRAKLMLNLANAIEALSGPELRGSDLHRRAIAEARAVFAAAGLDVSTEEEDRARRGDILQRKPIRGRTRGGGSTWQSFARGTGSIETDHLNGEIVLLGRLHGIPTPVNEALQRLARQHARALTPAGSVPAEALLEAVGAG
jgi:2-dehydropantoate 2-reductase